MIATRFGAYTIAAGHLGSEVGTPQWSHAFEPRPERVEQYESRLHAFSEATRFTRDLAAHLARQGVQ